MAQVNWRNEAVKYKRLLYSACNTIQQYWPEQMAEDVEKWWQAQRNLARLRRISAADCGKIIHELLEESDEIGEEIGEEAFSATGSGD